MMLDMNTKRTKPLPTLEQVRARVQAARGRWPELSEESGVPYKTLVKVASGETASPEFETVRALSEALDAMQIPAAT
jgi:DNA-binding phage protein